MEIQSNRINTGNNNINQFPAPPPYASVVYKLSGHEFDRIPPPAYSDVDAQSMTYINNYPGPPLTDGHIQSVSGEVIPINQETRRSKNIRIYLLINGIITILFGIAIVGVEIGIIASNAIIYYYYGFWGGAVIICIGINSILLQKRHHIIDCTKLFRSFFWQMILIGIVFGIGMVIILTDRCDDNGTEDSEVEQSCKHAHKILNGFLFGMFSAAFALSIINTIIFFILRR